MHTIKRLPPKSLVCIRDPYKWLCIGPSLIGLGIALAALTACHRNNEITYRIILPDRYVGWVRVDFAAKAPPGLDSHNTLTLRVGNDGRCQSTSVMVYTVPTKYEFFYDGPAGLRLVPDDFVDHGVNAGGFTARPEDPSYGTAWYFFVGPQEYRSKHPPSEFASHASPLPTPGPLPGQK